MSEVKVNKISPRTNCGTVQLGDSGDTFTIPSGATINNQGTATNFGATGSASWVTTKKTATFTATAGEGYFCDTAAVGAFTVNLPSSPSAGAVVAVADYANTFDTANLTIGRGGSNIEGDASDFVCNQEGVAITFVYVDATKGWIVTDTGNSSNAFTTPFIVATGGTITTCGNCKIHTFTGPGTFTVCNVATNCGPTRNQVSYLVVAGGGGGGKNFSGGGGGAGGFRENKSPVTPYTASPLEGAGAITVTATAFPITVGGGGPAPGSSAVGTNGSNSVFSTITSAGGGGGGSYTGNPVGINRGIPGGSGSGAAGYCGTHCAVGGTGNTPPVSPSQGNNGGQNNIGNPDYGAGGGGGATAVGVDGQATGSGSGNGGAGATTNISGSSTAYAGGGGGGATPSGPPGSGGTGGGASGGAGAGTAPSASVNTGGGGGGNGYAPGPAGGIGTASNGGSGIVIIRYKFQ